MNEPFNQHLTANAETWHELAKRGFVKTEDLIKARNYDNKYSYAEQTKALKNINDSLAQTIKRNPDNEQLIKFVGSVTDATDEMIRDKVKSSFRDLNKVTDDEIRIKSYKLGIPYEEFKSNVDKVRTEIETEKGRKRRAKEIEDMAWYDPDNWATSDYEKQRYIDDPNASIIGKESPKLGNAKNTRWGAISDMAFGAAAGVSDLLPGRPGIVAGPLLRGARDATHKLTDSKYQKEGGDIVGDFGKDLFVNVGSDVLPTALTRYMPRVVKFARKGKPNTGVAKYAEDVYSNKIAREKVNQMNDELDKFGWNLNSKNFNEGQIYDTPDIVLEEQIKSLPKNSILRKQLEQDAIIKSNAGVEYIDRAAMTNTLADFATVTPKKDKLMNVENLRTMPDGFHKNSQLELMISEEGDKPQILDYVLEQSKGANVSKKAKLGSKALDYWENYGDRVNKTLATMGVGKEVPMLPTAIQSRQTSKVNTDDREDIDWYKENYARDWAAGFAPRGNEDEPIMKAYREWQEENKQTKPKFRDIMRGE